MQLHFPRVLVLVLAVLIGSACSQSPQPEAESDPPSGPGTFLALSDIHFDPFYDPSLLPDLNSTPASGWKAIFEGSSVKTLCRLSEDRSGKRGCYDRHAQDTNYPLLKSALGTASGFAGNADYILITGDFLAHGFDSSYKARFANSTYDDYAGFVKKTFTFLQLELSAAFPSLPVFPTLGNNDAYCGDYGVSGESGFLADVASIWEPLVGAPLTGFAQSGSYTVAHPVVADLEFALFNDVPFSKNYGKYTFAYSDDAAKQACTAATTGSLTSAASTWLDTTLANAAGNVILAYHIPPGVDQYDTASSFLNGGCGALDVDFDLSTPLIPAVTAHRPKIHSVYAAHTHQDDLRFFQLGSSSEQMLPLPIRVNPSISIHNSNNPGFQVLTYDTGDSQLLNYTTYYLSNIDVAGTDDSGGNPIAPEWPELYEFSRDYLAAGGVQATGFNPYSLARLTAKFAADQSFAENTYWQFHPLRGPERGGGQISGADWDVYRCSLTQFQEAKFSSCVCPSQ